MTRSASTKAGVLFVLVAVGICLAASFLVMTTNREKVSRDRLACQDNLRRVGQAIGMYVVDNDGFLPTESAWYSRAIPSLPTTGCPTAEPVPRLDPPLQGAERGLTGYAFNPALIGENKTINGRLAALPLANAALAHAHTTIAVLDYTSGIPSTRVLDSFGAKNGGWPKQLKQGWKRHEEGGNYLFCDGHVAWFPESAILVTEPDICDGDKTLPNFCVK